MSNPNEGGIDETELMEAALEASSSSDVSSSPVLTRKVVPAPAVQNVSPLATSQKPAPSAGGRQILPVVYLNLPRNRVTPTGSPTAVTVLNQGNQSGSIVLNNVAQVSINHFSFQIMFRQERFVLTVYQVHQFGSYAF